MDNIISDTNGIENPFGLTENELEEISAVLTPKNTEFIEAEYKGLGKTPSYAELKIFGAILETRRRYADSYLISEIESDSIALRETYADLLQKARAVFEKKTERLSLDEAAYVCGEYMRYIGRRDRLTSLCADTDSISENSLSIYEENGKSTVVFEGKAKKRKSEKVRKIGKGYAVLLLDGENYDESAALFFADSKIDVSYNCRIKIGAYGIVGALCSLTDGVRVDTARLCSDIPAERLLTKEFFGKYLILCHRDNLKIITDKAIEMGLTATYFANTERDGLFTTRDMKMPIRLLRALLHSARETAVCPDEPNFSSVHKLRVTAKAKDGACRISENEILRHSGRVISPLCICPESNSFAEAVNGLTDALLNLVARGIDRRAVCSAVAYEFPRHGVSEKELGENLALILGVYRVGVELVLREGMTDVNYTDRRCLLATLYAEEPRRLIENKFTKEGSHITLLSLGSGSDGLVNFSDVRSLCDRFIELCKEGKVYSARAVTGDLSAALRDMSNELTAELADGGKPLIRVNCRGILFETDADTDLNLIGKVVTLPRAEVDFTDC